MFKPLLLVAAAIVIAHPAHADTVLNAQSVYADKDVTLGGGTYGSIAYDQTMPVGFSAAGATYGPLSASSQAMTDEAIALSQYYFSLPTTSYSLTGCTMDCVLTGTSGMNVITLTGAQFDDVNFRLDFTGAGATGLILNIGGLDPTLIDFTAGGLDPSMVLFNFYEATHLAGAGTPLIVEGTILAPFAHVDVADAIISGSVVSDRFKAADTTVLGQGFIGAVPEPTTWAMMIVGFGFIGYGMRRRKTQPQVRFA